MPKTKEAVILCGGQKLDGQTGNSDTQTSPPYGKVKIKDRYIKKFEEKPKLDFYVNADHYHEKT